MNAPQNRVAAGRLRSIPDSALPDGVLRRASAPLFIEASSIPVSVLPDGVDAERYQRAFADALTAHDDDARDAARRALAAAGVHAVAVDL